jgi:DNA transformation protein and related proteins
VDAEAIRDLFQELGAVRIRPMFGGKGIYLHDRMFALVASDELYLKVDDENRAAFERAGSRPFVYRQGVKAVATSYWLMPEEGLEDPSEAATWGRLALDAASRAAARTKPKKNAQSR